jgi:hypothetical protein
MIRLKICTVGLFLVAGVLSAGEKKLMHCFAFTAIEGASQADWQAFQKATDELPGKIPGLNKVWHGKLRRNLSIFGVNREARKKFRDGEKKVTAEVTLTSRQYGVCMEMDDGAALKTYAGHAAHEGWVEVYSKVRQPGTTTYDIIGQ